MGGVINRAVKSIVFVASAGPALWLVWALFFDTQALGANPIEYAIRFNGDWGMRFLLLSLCITPLKEIFNAPSLIRFRRMLGLFAFFYAFLHLASYIGLDQFFDWSAIWDDIVKRTYITVGMAAFVMLVPLAVTSTKGWVRRLSAPTWIKLHKLVYAASIAVIVHFYMMVKADVREPLVYAGLLSVLLGYRFVARAVRRRRRVLRRQQEQKQDVQPST